MTPLLLMLACTPDKGGDTAPGDGGSAICGLLPAGDGEGRATPGTTATVQVDADPQATLAWRADVGTITGTEPGTAAWEVPGDLAIHTDELHHLTVTATRDGCPTEQVDLAMSLGFDDPQRVVVLYNPTVDGSLAVAQAYQALHGLEDGQLCPMSSAETVTLPGAELPALVDTVQACIDAVGPQVHYLVPVWGLPYKVTDRIDDLGGSGAKATVSLDALLAAGPAGTTATAADWSPVWQTGDSMAGSYDPYLPFGELRQDLAEPFYLVARIDGVDSAAAIALLERTRQAMDLAAAGALAGTVYVDARFGDPPPATDSFGSYESGDWNMWGTATLFQELGWYDVVFDTNEAELGTDPAPLTAPDALYYAGWYSYYNYNDVFTWAPGAIGGHLDSCSACDIRAEGTWSGSALVRGITATFGAVSEPYVAGMPEYDQLFRYLTEGASFGEAAYESTRVELWMMVFVGDPLYRPYAG